MSERKFTLIGEADAPEPPVQDKAALTRLNTEMLMLALRALSQRAMTAISALFTVALVASAWWLVYTVLPNPTQPQLTALLGYGVFCLLIDIVRRKK